MACLQVEVVGVFERGFAEERQAGEGRIGIGQNQSSTLLYPCPDFNLS
jgi:hypothetical protein